MVYFYVKITPLPPSSEKSHSLFPSNSPLKIKVLSRCPLFENWPAESEGGGECTLCSSATSYKLFWKCEVPIFLFYLGYIYIYILLHIYYYIYIIIYIYYYIFIYGSNEKMRKWNKFSEIFWVRSKWTPNSKNPKIFKMEQNDVKINLD